MHPTSMTRFVPIATLAVLAAGCGQSASQQERSPQASSATRPVATNAYRAGMVWPQAALEGVLDTTRDDAGNECFVIVLDDHQAKPVSWPAGTSADFGKPARLLDKEGNVLAEEGDRLRAGGGFTEQRDDVCSAVGEWAFAVGPLKVLRNQ